MKGCLFRLLIICCGLVLLLVLTIAGVAKLISRPSSDAFNAAQAAIKARGIDPKSLEHLAVIDFDKPSFAKRLAIYDRDGSANHYLVAHGSKSGGVYARLFSNISGSHQTSLGLYQVGDQYTGKHGISFRLHGLDPGLNDKAMPRAIVLHSADYVSYQSIHENFWRGEGPRLGRSLGCPTVSTTDYPEVIAKLTPGTYLYHYCSKAEK